MNGHTYLSIPEWNLWTYPGWHKYGDTHYHIFTSEEPPNTLYVKFFNYTATYFPAYNTDREEESIGKIVCYKPVGVLGMDPDDSEKERKIFEKYCHPVIWWCPTDFVMNWDKI